MSDSSQPPTPTNPLAPNGLTADQVLPLIARYESGGRNVFNWMHDQAPGYYTASGLYQITNTTWGEGAKMAGVDTSQYPTAISAPPEVQAQVAKALYSRYGTRPWAMDRPLMQALRGAQDQAPPLAAPGNQLQAQAQAQAPQAPSQAPDMTSPGGPNPAVALQLLQLLLPAHRLAPVDYDPWAIQAKQVGASA